MRPIRSAIVLILLVAMVPGILPGQDSSAHIIAARLIGTPDTPVAQLYLGRQFAPLWLDDAGRLTSSGRDAVDLLRHAGDHGLDPSIYEVARLDMLLAGAGTAPDSTRADLDLALTDNLLRFLHDLRQGHARPASVARDSTAPDLASAVVEAVAADSLPRLAQAMTPPFRQYRLLQAALAREIVALETAPGDTGAGRRAEQIRLALERLRWAPRTLKGRMIVVNVPAFELVALDTQSCVARPELRSRVIVGDADRSRTPVLFDEMTAVEFWPYWNVPRSILLAEILPPLRRNSRYLRAREMEVVNSRGEVVGDGGTPEILAGLANGSLSVRQRPSRANALGVVKFLFPNLANVYAHDTPSRELFDQERRDFSHGCIRVEKASSLAQWVMAGEPGWSAERVRAALRGPVTRRVALERPIPVLIMYTTAVADPSGEVRYFDDVYGLDAPLTRALHRR